METRLYSNAIRFFFFFAFVIISSASLAQKEVNNWYFGNKAGISFNSGSPVALTNGQLITGEGCAVISDVNGGLLFYTDGISIWNKNHQVMTNGTGLFGESSSTQSAVIVPQPGNDSIYFVFTVSVNIAGLYYSVVNIKQQGGLGTVVQKNVFLLIDAREKLTAVKHCNNTDIWIITRKYNSDAYYAYLITASGVITVPIISNTGNFVNAPNDSPIGVMKFAPNGRKLAAAHYRNKDYVELLDFNNQTGKLSNPIKLKVTPSNADPFEGGNYGIEFSSDSRYLYVSSFYEDMDKTFIHQFDVSKKNQTDIQASRYTVTEELGRQYGAMQIAPDGKIYVTENGRNQLSTITKPGVQGLGCNFISRSFLLGPVGINYSFIGLPTFIQSFLFTSYTYSFVASFNCLQLGVDFEIDNKSGYDSLRWFFDDAPSGSFNTSTLETPTHIYSATGIYFPKLIIYKCTKNDTVVKKIWAGAVNTFLGKDSSLCEGDSLRLDGTAPNINAVYLWSTGSADSAVTVKTSGKYWVRVTLADCIYSDTINVVFNSKPINFSLGPDVSICNGDSALFKSNIAMNGLNLLWNTGSNASQIKVNQAGNYWLKATNQYSCSRSDTVQLSTKILPQFNLGNNISVCEGDTVLLNAVVSASSFLWNNGSVLQSTKIFSTGLYWCEATKDGCTYRDSITVTVKPLPVVNLGKDSILCEGQFLDLNAFNSGAAYSWQDNSAQSNYRVTKAGEYNVRVILSSCVKRDTIKVAYNLRPRFTLGADRTICPGEIIILQPNPNSFTNTTYQWQNGDTLLSLSVTQPGLFILNLTNKCGTTADSIFLKESTCKVFVPNTFTPNGDRYNELFRVLNVENIKEFNLRIFDRWGNLIFETVDKYKGWNGTRNGIEQPSGLFTYTINYTEKNTGLSVFRKGTIQLIR